MHDSDLAQTTSPSLFSLVTMLSDHHDGYSTRAIHVGSEPDPVTGALAPALNVSTTFKFKGIDETTVSSTRDKLANV